MARHRRVAEAIVIVPFLPPNGDAANAVTRSESPRVLVAGGAGGIGLACAEAFAASGAEVIITDCDGTALTRAAERLGAFSRYCDAIGSASVELLAEEMASLFPHLDVLINAAGRGYVRALAMTRVTRAMLPLLRRARGSRLIVNVASTGLATSAEAIFPYASSPDAFDKLSDMFRDELRGTGIELVIMTPSLAPKRAVGARLHRFGDAQELNERETAARILSLVAMARPGWRQTPGNILKRA